MTRSHGFALLVGVVLIPWATAGADDEARRKRPEGGGAPGLLPPAEVMERLGLSSEQKDKIAKLQQEFQEKNKEALDKVKGQMDKIREAMAKAREDKDREASRKASEQMMEVTQGLQKLRGEFEGQLSSVLNEEQKKKLAEAQRDQPRRPGVRPPDGRGTPMPPMLERLNLTPEQKEQISKLQKEFDAKVQGVLTDEQKKKLEELKKDPPRRPREQQ